MRANRMWSELSRNLFGPAILALALAAGGGGALAEEPMTVPEVVAELVELTPKLTPFTVKYEKDAKTLVFNESIESGDKALAGRVGELRARLDRMDGKRITYEAGDPKMTLLIKGKPIAGQVLFHCRADARCVSRGINGSTAGSSVAETDEAGFRIDVFDASITYNQLQRFADLIRHLVTISE